MNIFAHINYIQGHTEVTCTSGLFGGGSNVCYKCKGLGVSELLT